MKKNLISIIILALLVVNIVLTAIMMFSVTGAANKTAALVDNIATALNLELTAQTGEGADAVNVPMEETEVYTIPESMTISLKPDEDGTPHFCMILKEVQDLFDSEFIFNVAFSGTMYQ